ncbi:MAG: hypothetical protein U1E76_24005 [Planctomycetota bacterium]
MPSSLHADSEALAGPAGLMLHRGSIKAWKAPHQRAIIDDAKRAAIVANIRAASAASRSKVVTCGAHFDLFARTGSAIGSGEGAW